MGSGSLHHFVNWPCPWKVQSVPIKKEVNFRSLPFNVELFLNNLFGIALDGV